MKITILILNYRTKLLTETCVRSVLNSLPKEEVEIYVGDNCSQDGSVEYLQDIFSSEPNVHIVQNRTNLGFAGGNNEIAKLAKGQYLLFLNSDTVVSDSNAITDIVREMELDESVGIGACRLLNRDGTTQISYAKIPRVRDIVAVYLFGKTTNHYKKIVDDATAVETVIGAFMLIRRDVFFTLGMFDERYFFNTEDIDLCYRVLKSGLMVKYFPRYSIVHLGGQSQQGMSWIDNRYLHSSLVEFFRKNHGRVIALWVQSVIWVGLLARRLKHVFLASG